MSIWWNPKMPSIFVFPSIPIPEPNKPKVIVDISRCTCGVKFTGGICSDWCDTNNPPPDTEELPF